MKTEDQHIPEAKPDFDSQRSAVSAAPETLIERVKRNPLVVAGTLFIMGMGMMQTINLYLEDKTLPAIVTPVTKDAHAAPVPSPSPTLSLPIRIGVIGPITGSYEAFGLSQMRGSVAALLRSLVEQCEVHGELDKYFSITAYDESTVLNDPRALTEMFNTALTRNDLILGPMFSQDAVAVLQGRRVSKPILLTTAATSVLRSHPDFGKTLFQLASDLETYAGQLMQYFGDFAEPRIRTVVSIYQGDEYGIGAHRLLAAHSGNQNIRFEGIELPVDYSSGDRPALVAEVIRRLNESLVMKLDPTTLVVVTAVGTPLRETMKVLRSRTAARIATFSSIEQENLGSGLFDGVVVTYSFAPRTYSLSTLQFFKYLTEAQAHLEQDVLRRSIKWNTASTVDAEAHDAALYWFTKEIAPRLQLRCSKPMLRPFATDLTVTGEGPNFRATAALQLFTIEKGRMQPVSIER